MTLGNLDRRKRALLHIFCVYGGLIGVSAGMVLFSVSPYPVAAISTVIGSGLLITSSSACRGKPIDRENWVNSAVALGWSRAQQRSSWWVAQFFVAGLIASACFMIATSKS